MPDLEALIAAQQSLSRSLESATERTLPDGRIAYVTLLTFGRARINRGDAIAVDDGW